MKHVKKFKVKQPDRENQILNPTSSKKKKVGLRPVKEEKYRNKKQFYNELYEDE